MSGQGASSKLSAWWISPLWASKLRNSESPGCLTSCNATTSGRRLASISTYCNRRPRHHHELRRSGEDDGWHAKTDVDLDVLSLSRSACDQHGGSHRKQQACVYVWHVVFPFLVSGVRLVCDARSLCIHTVNER